MTKVKQKQTKRKVSILNHFTFFRIKRFPTKNVFEVIHFLLQLYEVLSCFEA